MGEHDVELARLSAQFDAGFTHMNLRFDDTARELADIKAEVKRTNGRVTALELSAARADGRRDAVTDYDNQSLTLASIKWYLVVIAGTAGATITVLRFLGKL